MELNQLENNSVMSYEPMLRGQGIYILMNCKKERIKADYMCGKVIIYSKRKIPKLLKIIKDSFDYCKNLEEPVFSAPFQTFTAGNKFLALAIQEKDLILTTNEKFKDVVYYQFCKRIPITKNYELFYTINELKNVVENTYRMLI